MKQEVLAHFSQTWLTSTALILFLTVFVVMIVYIWRKSSADIYKEASLLPMDEGTKHE